MTESLEPQRERPLVLITGATGYVGGRLLRRLQCFPVALRCMARRPEFLLPRVDCGTEVVPGDVLDPDSLRTAMRGAATSYYLVHSMGKSKKFEEDELRGARNFGDVAKQAGVKRIIYLGGIVDETQELSAHLRSRKAVGDALRASGVETIELRASIIIGSGSASFDMIRALVDRLPMMLTPRWVSTPSQPIGIEDVLDYLEQAMTAKTEGHQVFEIGGPTVLSYKKLMAEYASQRGLRRLMVPVPVLTPRLSSLWLGLVTPLYARVGRILIDSIKHPSVVQDKTADAVFNIEPMSPKEAIRLALADERKELMESKWTDALSSVGDGSRWDDTVRGSRLVDLRRVHVAASPEQAFQPIAAIGGKSGWYFGNWLWRLRGWLDLLVGGVGLRRGRKHPLDLATGDYLDWWRVNTVEPGRRLVLEAEMKTPGRVWLIFEVDPTNGGAWITQTAVFEPVGLLGLAYWYLLYPIHILVFRGMLKGIANRAEAIDVPAVSDAQAQDGDGSSR